MELLIPFGISNTTDEIIEPDDAERGRACNCRCPGCDMPLLSRHPKNEESRKHFAHDSRHPDAVESVIKECPFNRWLAVSIMARHLADSFIGENIHFPELIKYVGCDSCRLERLVKVTEQSNLNIDLAESEYRRFGSVFDLRLVFGKHDVLVWLTYKNRPLPLITEDQLNELETTGILEIDVSSFGFAAFSKGTESFSEHVREFFLQSGRRAWCFHPRTKTVVKTSRKKHHCEQESFEVADRRMNSEGDKFGAIEQAVRSVDWKIRYQRKEIQPTTYLCLQCQTEWVQVTEGAPNCPKGCGHLYARKLS